MIIQFASFATGDTNGQTHCDEMVSLELTVGVAGHLCALQIRLGLDPVVTLNITGVIQSPSSATVFVRLVFDPHHAWRWVPAYERYRQTHPEQCRRVIEEFEDKVNAYGYSLEQPRNVTVTEKLRPFIN